MLMKKKTPKKNGLTFFLISLCVILLDQLFKFFIRNSMNIGDSIAVIKNIFHITYVTNFGAGFGIMQGKTSLLIWFAIIVVGIILFYYGKIQKKKSLQIFSGLILGGTLSNLIDRLLFGFVIDFLDFRIWPVFNIGDSCVCIGAVFLMIYIIKKEN
ncbi:signal peptidase II [Candidatus Woesearchaeota archaeon CG10_big_fil_rev_8_21_14_0_10_33_12]|nr:MAG: signal peptidase II [Candidatus Woesearchaeota archaeon CG10_big_fil_rev_8_21_14_0_10_33_12]